jgi:hypothetical protein
METLSSQLSCSVCSHHPPPPAPPGASKPSITLQPFYMLHLDIQQQGVRSVEDALDVLTAGEHLSGELSAAAAAFLDWVS